MATKISMNNLVKVGMSTYYGNLDDSEWVCDFMRQDLRDIDHDGGHVKIKYLDWTENDDTVINDLVEDFEMDWRQFDNTVCEECKSDIDGSVMMASNHKFENISELLAAYWIKFDWYEFYKPRYYNYENDSLDIKIEFEDMDWSLEKYWLKDLVQKYIDEVRVPSRDWYQSFEPDKIEDVTRDDYCVMRAILQKENVFDTIKDELQDLVDNSWYEWYQNSVRVQYYTKGWKYFILEYNDWYLKEVSQDFIYPPKKEDD